MAFYTEKRTEDFLTDEIRCLAMPDGTQRQVIGTRLMWRHYDFSVSHCKFSEQRLVTMTLNNMAETGLPFDKQLHEIVAYIGFSFRQGLALDDFHPHKVDFPQLLPVFNPKKAKQENA